MFKDHDEEGVEPQVANTVSGPVGPIVQAGSITGGIHMGSRQEPAAPAPRELPGDINSFVGRIEQMNVLDELLAESENAAAHSPPIVAVVSGMAGVGKSALVTHWAHGHGGRFPDGHLHVNLRGYEPDRPLSAAEAQGQLLRSLGTSDRHLPKSVDARAKLFRSLVAGRRMLVVLDNANSDEQVRPLLPGVPSCLVLITSRAALGGLVSRDGARRIGLDLLTQAQAVNLLRTLIGTRVDAESAAANALVDHCARLPLALRIAADLAVSNHDAPLAELVGELADEKHRLDLLDAGSDPRTAMRAVFSWSYRALSDEQARVFRLLGLHSGRTFTPAAVAALADLELFAAASALRSLAQSHLVERVANQQFRMHDLLRVYASELALAKGELA